MYTSQKFYKTERIQYVHEQKTCQASRIQFVYESKMKKALVYNKIEEGGFSILKKVGHSYWRR